MTRNQIYERTLRLLLDAGLDHAEADAKARDQAEEQWRQHIKALRQERAA